MDHITFCLLSETDKRLPVYLTTSGQWHHQDPVKRPRGFPSYQWFLSLSGEGALYVDGRSYQVRAGQAICLFPDVPHSYRAVKEPWGVMFVSMEGSQCGPLLELAGIRQSGVYTITEFERMKSDLLHMLTVSKCGGTFSGLECSKLMYTFLLDLTKYVTTNQSSVHQNAKRLQPVIQYIKQNCHRPLSIQQLAEEAGITPQYLCLLFKLAMNLRPMEYVNRERINRSKQLIFLEPELKTKEIARQSGFEHPSYFCTVFKKLEGMTPEQFKKTQGLLP